MSTFAPKSITSYFFTIYSEKKIESGEVGGGEGIIGETLISQLKRSQIKTIRNYVRQESNASLGFKEKPTKKKRAVKKKKKMKVNKKENQQSPVLDRNTPVNIPHLKVTSENPQKRRSMPSDTANEMNSTPTGKVTLLIDNVKRMPSPREETNNSPVRKDLKKFSPVPHKHRGSLPPARDDFRNSPIEEIKSGNRKFSLPQKNDSPSDSPHTPSPYSSPKSPFNNSPASSPSSSPRSRKDEEMRVNKLKLLQTFELEDHNSPRSPRGRSPRENLDQLINDYDEKNKDNNPKRLLRQFLEFTKEEKK